jgi:capsular polysaccharide biosynthesis protein
LFRKETGKNIPLIIHSKIADTRHFKYVCEAGIVKNDIYILKDNESVQVNKLYKASAAFTKQYWKGLHSALSNHKHEQEAGRRIFINRISKVGRTISNFDEVEKVLQKFKFEICDTGNMSVENQSKLFGSASVIVGIHGAGLTNLIFANESTKVIEINPMYPNEDQLRPHYYWVCQCLDFNYQVYSPGKLSDGASFNVDCSMLEEYILKMI